MPRVPRIRFTKWVRWDDRTLIGGARLPGIYLLGRFNSPPTGPADHLAGQVIYIGETCRKTLLRRWRQFNRSAFTGKRGKLSRDVAKRGHTGGRTYKEVFGDRGKNLYVAAMPVRGLQKRTEPYFIRYVERRLLWEYCKKWGRAPACNRK